MPIITFRSTTTKDKRAYATAGDTGTILAVARANDVKIPFECQEGECGSCLIRVEYVEGKPRMAIALTEREKTKLKELGKITEEQIADAEVNDIAPPYRLACQFIAREEEVIIHYEHCPAEA
ncbi:2Fe-2S iron-sulfur cluster binding domain-containing protein [Xanthobacter autotrophicus]|jgi:ferredoxin|uniref:2Fe-2S iron-sulfur cluster binding domain-containing protein n=2 Tax=Xanthobacter autotrophicus TaxID=280 RepID=A0A6C1KQM2_XANAU|nr:2Fe-2S iron-sulfur cluster binding domain-containing protein [Xanthobacter autotrophicus]TLX42076.1 2Fe-2S iron-sulfur cluster binding domain-containing protein [Xanthobacter autotrophicus]